MSWSDTLLEASFRGIAFDLLSSDDSAWRATAEHVYPYRDGAAVEDLGRGARRIQCEAIFWGADYESRLRDFIRVLDMAGAGDLLHPVFGLLFAQAANYRVRHEADHVDQARVSLEFIESTPDQPFFDHRLASQRAEAIGQAAGAATAAAGEALATTVAQTIQANPTAPLPNLRATLMGSIDRAIGQARGWVASGLDVLAEPRAWAADLASAAGAVLDTVAFAQAVPGQLLNDWMTAVTLLEALLPAAGEPAVAGSDTPTEAQAVYAAQLTTAVTLATTLAAAAQILLEAEAMHASLSPIEVERVAGEARTRIDAAIKPVRVFYPLARSRPIVESLKQTALAIQEAAAAIIESRPPLLDRVVDSPTNLRLLAHRWYGDHTRAAELLRLNPLRMPNCIQPGDVLRAYAN